MNLFSSHLNKTIFSILCIVIFLYLVKSKEQFSNIISHEHDGQGQHHHHLQSCDNGQFRLNTQQQSHSSGGQQFEDIDGDVTSIQGNGVGVGTGGNSIVDFETGSTIVETGNTTVELDAGNTTVEVEINIPQAAADGLDNAGIPAQDVRDIVNDAADKITKEQLNSLRLTAYNDIEKYIKEHNEALKTQYDEALSAVNTEIYAMNDKINRDGIKPLEEENKAKKNEIAHLKDKIKTINDDIRTRTSELNDAEQSVKNLTNEYNKLVKGTSDRKSNNDKLTELLIKAGTLNNNANEYKKCEQREYEEINSKGQKTGKNFFNAMLNVMFGGSISNFISGGNSQKMMEYSKYDQCNWSYGSNITKDKLQSLRF